MQENIVSIVAQSYGITPEVIIRNDRRKLLVEARQVIAYCLRLIGNFSFPVIGEILGGRDHTTIMHACRKIAERIEKEKKFAVRVGIILDRARGMIPTREDAPVHLGEDAQLAPDDDAVGKRAIITGNLELTERENYFLDKYRKGITLKQIGKENRLSRERIRQIIKKAIMKEVGAKLNEGFEIDVEEALKGEKNFHIHSRDALSDDEKEKIRSRFLPLANRYTSLSQFAHDVGVPIAKLSQYFPEIVSIIEKTVKEKKDRWSVQYIRCRGCGTTIIPHMKKGYCEQCMGVYRGKRRETVLGANPQCAVCGIERKRAIQKYHKDLFITKGGRVLCRGCFAQFTGSKMVEKRWSDN